MSRLYCLVPDLLASLQYLALSLNEKRVSSILWGRQNFIENNKMNGSELKDLRGKFRQTHNFDLPGCCQNFRLSFRSKLQKDELINIQYQIQYCLRYNNINIKLAQPIRFHSWIAAIPILQWANSFANIFHASTSFTDLIFHVPNENNLFIANIANNTSAIVTL